MVVFSAPWAEQCKQILDVFADLSTKAQFGQLQFLDVAAEDFAEISLNHQIEAVPTVLFFRNGTALDRIDGIDIAALSTKCRSLAGVVEDEKTSLEERLKSLINRANVMVFMKGDRNTPRCGFSKTLIGILNDTGSVVDQSLTLVKPYLNLSLSPSFSAAYETFDILSDETVRQGLKTFSDWPTYPQVYVKGELIGGLDIIKELLAGGELNDALKG